MVNGSGQDNAPGKDAVTRYRENYLSEQEGVYLYRKLADIETDTRLAELYRRIAETEQRHATRWQAYLEAAGVPLPVYSPDWRTRTLVWIAEHFGTSSVLSTISSMENTAVHGYDNQPEAVAAGMPADERSHARLFQYLQRTVKGGVAGPLLAQFEGRHRSTGGNELRAAVLGASDGLTSNLSLVMGVAGATPAGHAVLIAGL
ncbi:MAG: VIT1/CCC1 transporter family protein, partial [Ktedonobacterales bacterium]